MAREVEGHGGDLYAAALRAAGAEHLYTLIGGHIFAMLDAAERHGLRTVEVRHESAAGFAAEAHGKLARRPGVALVDAGPGVMNAINTIASAASNGVPMVLTAGHPPRGLAGMGSLNETPQAPVLAPTVKHVVAVNATEEIGVRTLEAMTMASARHRGPVYLEIPLDATFARARVSIDVPSPAVDEADGDAEAAATLLADAERPVLFLGSDVWADRAEEAARALVELQRMPVIPNGMARGIVPSDHPLAFSGARGVALKRADLVIVVGTPIDFRLQYGNAFGSAKVVHLQDHPSRIARHVPLAAAAAGPLADLLGVLAKAPVRDRDGWIAELRAAEISKRESYASELCASQTPIHPARIYGELVPRVPRDALYIADGGDFASYAGKYVDVYEPGLWLDPGPYGCLGTSAGYALAAATLEPERRIVVLLGDGAAGFSMGDWDSLVRYGANVTFICGNNGVWGLEKQPMRNLYGREVGADLRPEVRYDQIMAAFGGHGYFVRAPDELGPSIEVALATPGPSLVNVVTDPEISYPRGQG